MHTLVEKTTEQRFKEWKDLRNKLETSSSPLKDAAEFVENLPKTDLYTDPYDQSTWPTPWELLDENEFCPFNIVLGICYTLQLTEKFKNITPELKICIDYSTSSTYYILQLDNMIYGYTEDTWTHKSNLSKHLKTIKIYTMPALH